MIKNMLTLVAVILQILSAQAHPMMKTKVLFPKGTTLVVLGEDDSFWLCRTAAPVRYGLNW